MDSIWIKGEQRVGLVIEDAESVVFMNIQNDKAIVWCRNRFEFIFSNVNKIEVSNIEFKSCASILLIHSHRWNITVVNITIEHGGIEISADCKLNMNNYTVFIHLYNLNITLNSTGIYYHALGCDG